MTVINRQKQTIKERQIGDKQAEDPTGGEDKEVTKRSWQLRGNRNLPVWRATERARR